MFRYVFVRLFAILSATLLDRGAAYDRCIVIMVDLSFTALI